MGNVERCDKTLPTNEMMFRVRGDAALRARFLSDLEGLAREFGLSRAEYEALRDKDPRRLMDLGVHQYYVPQILRLLFGASVLVLALTRGGADVLAYMPAVAWRSGTGMVVWNELAK